MSYPSTSDPKFISTLKTWFRDQPELLALIRYHAHAGSKDFEFFSAFEALVERFRALPPRTCVTVFRQPQLPLRGVVDDAFIARCMSALPDGSEYLIAELERRTAGAGSWWHSAASVSHDEFREDLDSSRGRLVAVGLYPPWLVDSEDVISAVVPDEHGVVQTGVY
jgi:hypothetical protein